MALSVFPVILAFVVLAGALLVIVYAGGYRAAADQNLVEQHIAARRTLLETRKKIREHYQKKQRELKLELKKASIEDFLRWKNSEDSPEEESLRHQVEALNELVRKEPEVVASVLRGVVANGGES